MFAPKTSSTTLRCENCGRSIVLIVRPLTEAEATWRAIECPHCRKPNMVRLAAEIVRVVGDEPAA